MFFVKRAYKYVTRKLGKVVTIGVILFIVSSLVLTGLVIGSAAKSSAKVARSKLGANITYTSDLSSVMQQNRGNNTTGRTTGGFRIEIPDDYTAVTTKEIEAIVNNSKYVKYYTINASLGGEAIDFSYYNPFDEDENTDTDRPGFNVVIRGNINSNVNITGVDKVSKNELFNTDLLVDGRYFTDEEIDNNSNKIIIEQTIADINDIKVGDNVTIKVSSTQGMMGGSSTPSTAEIEYEVIGIYKTDSPTDVSGNIMRNAGSLSENTMYIPYTSVLTSSLAGLSGTELDNAEAEIEENGYTVSSVTFTLNNPEDIDAFILEVKDMSDVDTTYRMFNANNEAYEKMTGPIESVASTSTVLVVVVVIAGAFIIGLLSMLSIKDRKYELGVLLSLGESRAKIVMQLITEMLIVSVISFTLAAVASNFVAQGTTNYLLNQEITSSEEEVTNNSFGNTRGGMFIGGQMLRPGMTSLSTIDVDIIDELTVDVNISDVLQMMGIGILIIVIGNSVQALFVLRAKPKEILLER